MGRSRSISSFFWIRPSVPLFSAPALRAVVVVADGESGEHRTPSGPLLPLHPASSGIKGTGWMAGAARGPRNLDTTGTDPQVVMNPGTIGFGCMEGGLPRSFWG
jgi:hypothetical protein